MITSNFLNNCTEDEAGLLHLILVETFYDCKYEPSFSCVKTLRKDVVIKKLENCKSKIKPEYVSIVDNLQKKLYLEA